MMMCRGLLPEIKSGGGFVGMLERLERLEELRELGMANKLFFKVLKPSVLQKVIKQNPNTPLISYHMKFTLTGLLLFGALSLQAQHSGNIVYDRQSYTKTKAQQDAPKLYLTDSTFVIKADVLMNVIADAYVVTFGVADTAATITDANNRINKRIAGFKSSLPKFNIKPSDVFVDMTTQTKFYDFNTSGPIVEQYQKGFEIKKNVIIKVNSVKNLDELLVAASKFGIYDLIKVDYIVNDLDTISNQLFKLAAGIIAKKKDRYVAATGMQLKPAGQIYDETLHSYYPSELYQSYTPTKNSATYTGYYEKRKELAPTTTYYYDTLDYSGLDKVINPIVTEPAVEFVFSLQIKYKIANYK